MEDLILTREQAIEAERIAIEEQGISIEQLMESAGMQVAEKAKEICKGKKIVLLAGKGNNGGDVLVAAKHLHNWGFDCYIIYPFSETDFKTLPKKQFEIVKKAGIKNFEFPGQGAKELENADLIVDGLFGFNLQGAVKGKFAQLIKKVNSLEKRVLAVDVPSGFDLGKERAEGVCIKADETITLGVMKKGLLSEDGKKVSGNVSVANIGIPEEVYKRVLILNNKV